MYPRPRDFQRYWILLVLLIMFIGVSLYGVNVQLTWTILQTMYRGKAGIDWFNTVFYHNYTFILAAVLALLTFNPQIGRSDVYELWETIRWLIRGAYEQSETKGALPTFSFKTRKTMWFFWQFLKWMVAFSVIASLNGLPFLGKVTPIFYMALTGIGDWRLTPRILILPMVPASGSELILLMPTMEVQYRLIYVVSVTVLAVIALRMSVKLIRHLIRQERNVWIRDLFIVLTCIVVGIILGAPYWAMDVTTVFDYIILLVLLVAFSVASFFFHFIGIGEGSSLAKRRRTIVMFFALATIGAVVVNAAIIAGFRLNWNNNWIGYEWKPLTEKQISVTRWAAGIQEIERMTLSDLPSGNVTEILKHVRQWDSQAAYTRMINQIGYNWMSLADSDILYINGREFWAAPTTIRYPSTDWISTHLIYTHTSKIIMIDSHSGEYANVTEAFGIPNEPLIYYGEGFQNPVYVNVRGFNEVEYVSYSREPDYVLSGWQRTLWFLFQGQVGFASSPPQDEIKMLYNRDVLERVRSILIYGLDRDPDAYLVSDGAHVYYAVQVYINYPLNSGFSTSNYLRFFGVVLVSVEDGNMKGYVVDESDGFLLDFYRKYYSSWKPLSDTEASWLKLQIRYPEALLGTHSKPGQVDEDFVYHVEDPFVWRSGSEFYERPPETEVLYVLFMDRDRIYFAGLQIVEYYKSASKNLAGIYLVYGGEQLGRTTLYKVSNVTQWLGPTAALDSLKANKEVQEKLTLYRYPTESRFGNILLYSVGGKPYYFIPLYLTRSVMSTMPAIGIVDATSGSIVAMGSDAAEAYYKLVKTPVSTGENERLSKVMNLFVENNRQLVNVTAVHADVDIQLGNLTYLDETQWDQTKTVVEKFIGDHVQSDEKVFMWTSDNKTVNLGVLKLEGGVWRYLYYISIRYG